MTASAAVKALGSLLQIGDGTNSPEAFTSIAEVFNLGGPKYSQKFVETTNHTSTGAYEEFLATLKSAGSVTMTMNFLGSPDKTQVYASSGLMYDFDAQTLRHFQIKFTNHIIVSFSAYIENFEPSANRGEVLTASASLKISGQPVWSTW